MKTSCLVTYNDIVLIFFQKPLLELIIGSAQIVGRAFTRAVREEFRTSQQAAERAGGGRQGARRVANDSITGMTLQVHFMLKSYKNPNQIV